MVSRWLPAAVATLLVLVGLPLLIGGIRLVSVGGSLYYGVSGAALVASGVLIVRGRMEGAWIFSAFLIATLLWSLHEVGMAFWLLFPRIVLPGVLGVLVALCLPALHQPSAYDKLRRRVAYSIAALFGMALAGIAAHAFRPSLIGDPHLLADRAFSVSKGEGEASSDRDWRHYGRTAAGTRYSPADQITPGNVRQLQVAWTYRWGDSERLTGEEQSTPLQVGERLYFCTNRNLVIALDADSGEERWRFDPHSDPAPLQRCRGVGYHEMTASPRTPRVTCSTRILASTIDARLFALDAKSGTLCPGFGSHGFIDLKSGMGPMAPGDYYQTSAPAVARDLVIIGGRVEDGRRMSMPSGVVRAFSAITGELIWGWDNGNPAIAQMPPDGESYTRSSPNMWSTPVYDERLGLLYVSLGAPTGANDFWGGWRTPKLEQYANAIVALEIATGRPRWHFQTVHHDLWDYDLASQPTLVDVSDDQGGSTPALIQSTKRGQIFMLDRRDGRPISPIVEKPVPKAGLQSDWTSPTQPYSVGMPSIGTEALTEAKMWGITPFDQLWCRIQFKRLRYEGEFTAPTTMPTLIYPGWFGGVNWGGVSVDEHRRTLIVNDIRVPIEVRLVPRKEIDRLNTNKAATTETAHGPLLGQRDGPFAASVRMFTSPLGIPCNAPPWGTMMAIDLSTRKALWQVPMGTTRDDAALSLGWPLPMGLPTLGGTLVTGSGLVFFAGTQDFYLRAMDVRTGEELWKGRLPVGAQATPMTYISARSRRQLVVIVAGGAAQSKHRGDYVIAYALPNASRRH